MPFIFGMLLGSLFSAGEFFGAMCLLPFAMLALGLVGWGCYEAIHWYGVASTAYIPSAWCAWPWHWPGAYWSKEFFDYIDQLFPVLFQIDGSADIDHSAIPLLAWMASLPMLVMRAGLGLVLNMFVAMAPLIILARLMRPLVWTIKALTLTFPILARIEVDGTRGWSQAIVAFCHYVNHSNELTPVVIKDGKFSHAPGTSDVAD